MLLAELCDPSRQVHYKNSHHIPQRSLQHRKTECHQKDHMSLKNPQNADPELLP